MAKIIVVAETGTTSSDPVVFQEWVGTSLLQSPHASQQLLERLSWAVADAQAVEAEREPAGARPGH